MNKEINKIISWIEMSYIRLNYKEELLLVNYIKQLQQENQELKKQLEEYKLITIDYQELEARNKKYKEVIDKSIKLIDDTYYSKNTTNIDSIVLSSDKLIKVREILKEVNKWI